MHSFYRQIVKGLQTNYQYYLFTEDVEKLGVTLSIRLYMYSCSSESDSDTEQMLNLSVLGSVINNATIFTWLIV
jgi:hypothetical protein